MISDLRTIIKRLKLKINIAGKSQRESKHDLKIYMKKHYDPALVDELNKQCKQLLNKIHIVDETYVSEEEYSRVSEMEYEKKEYDSMKHRMGKDKMKLTVNK